MGIWRVGLSGWGAGAIIVYKIAFPTISLLSTLSFKMEDGIILNGQQQSSVLLVLSSLTIWMSDGSYRC
jgi:hypothetical protein